MQVLNFSEVHFNLFSSSTKSCRLYKLSLHEEFRVKVQQLPWSRSEVKSAAFVIFHKQLITFLKKNFVAKQPS